MKNIYLLFLIIISIISLSGMISLPSYEYFAGTQTVFLLGDSILNNAGYVRKKYTVGNIIKKTYHKTIVLAEDNATIATTKEQINKLKRLYPNFDSSNSYIFLSVGGNDILQSGHTAAVEELFNKYKQLVDTLLNSFGNATIALITIYYPQAPLYKKYYRSIEQWNGLLAAYAQKKNLNLIMVDRKLKDKRDFIHDIEPSQKGSQIIANAILRNI